MGQIKSFLILHGEKVVLAIVGAICLYSIVINVSKDRQMLDLPGGKDPFEVDEADLKQKITYARNHLSSRNSVMEKPEVAKTSHEIAALVLRGRVGSPAVNLQWLKYLQPPPIGIPPLLKTPPVVSVQVPTEYRTRLGNAEELMVEASSSRVLISCKDSEFLNYPLPGSRRVMLFRKPIAFAKETLSDSWRAALRQSPASGDMLAAAEKADEEENEDASDGPAIDWFGNTVEKEEQEAVAFSRKTYEQALRRQQQLAVDMLRQTINEDDLVADGWELVTDQMPVLKGELDGFARKQLLSKGMTEELVHLPKAKAEDGEEGQGATEEEEPTREVEAEEVAEESTPKSNDPWAILEPIEPEEETAVVAEEEVVEESDLQTYVFVDEGIRENMVYRYCVIACVKPQWPPEDIMTDPKYEGWDIYCQVDGISGLPVTGGVFAKPERFVQPKIEELQGMKGLAGAVRGVHLSFESAYPTKKTDEPSKGVEETDEIKVVLDPSNPPAKSMRDEKGRLSPRGWAYRNQEPCFSDFVYSDPVLVPPEKRLVLQGVLNTNPPSAKFEVFLVADGETEDAIFTVAEPFLPREVTLKDFVKTQKTEDGRVVPVMPPAVKTLEEVYAEIPGIRPAQIGEKKSIAGKTWDFSTNWGVVDVRSYVVRGVREKYVNGEWKKVGTIPQRTRYYVVIREIEVPAGQQPRYRRVYEKEPESRREGFRYVYEYEFEEEAWRKKVEDSRRRKSAPSATE